MTGITLRDAAGAALARLRAHDAAILGALVAAGVLRIGFAHFVHERLDEVAAERSRRIDLRYQDAARALPPEGRVGYLSDAGSESEEGARLYTQALYSLAPRLLVKDSGRERFLLVNLSNAGRLDELRLGRGLRLRAGGHPQVAVFERTER